MNIHTIILAAGEGSRMKSKRAKSLQRVGGKTMLEMICKTAESISAKITLIVGFDKNLNRLGYGKGYYDKVISKLRKIKKIFVIGLAYDNQMVHSIPIENHDEKMDFILTDQKIYR